MALYNQSEGVLKNLTKKELKLLKEKEEVIKNNKLYKDGLESSAKKFLLNN